MIIMLEKKLQTNQIRPYFIYDDSTFELIRIRRQMFQESESNSSVRVGIESEDLFEDGRGEFVLS